MREVQIAECGGEPMQIFLETKAAAQGTPVASSIVPMRE